MHQNALKSLEKEVILCWKTTVRFLYEPCAYVISCSVALLDKLFTSLYSTCSNSSC